MQDAQRILSKIRRLELKTRSLVDAAFAGQYRSVFKGRGMNFEEVREYAPGDEVRTIDGSGNNPDDPSVGKTGGHLLRNFTSAYADGVSAPGDVGRPNPRAISNAVNAQAALVANSMGLTNMAVVWGQLLDHDLSLTPAGTTDTLKIHADQLDGSLSYLDFKYQKVDTLSTGVTLNDVTPYTPKWKAAIGVQYDIPDVLKGMVTVRLDGAYQSKIYTEAANIDSLAVSSTVPANSPVTPSPFSNAGGGGLAEGAVAGCFVRRDRKHERPEQQGREFHRMRDRDGDRGPDRIGIAAGAQEARPQPA